MDNADPNTAGQFRDVPVTLTVSVGHARTPIGRLLSLEPDAVLALDTRLEDPVKIYAGETIVAFGELQEAPDGQLAVRITKLSETSEVD